MSSYTVYRASDNRLRGAVCEEPRRGYVLHLEKTFIYPDGTPVVESIDLSITRARYYPATGNYRLAAGSIFIFFVRPLAKDEPLPVIRI